MNANLYIQVETYTPEDIRRAFELCADMYMDEETGQTPHYEELMRALRHNRKTDTTNAQITTYPSVMSGHIP